MTPQVRSIEHTRAIPVADLKAAAATAAAAAEEVAPPDSATAALIVEGRAYAVPSTGGVVGRRPDCAVQIDHPGVSRRHLSLRPMADGTWLLHDLGSTNGVWINGEPVSEPRLIQDGDVLGLGRVSATFESRDDVAAA